MIQIGRKIYYLKSNGQVIIDTGPMIGFARGTTGDVNKATWGMNIPKSITTTA